MQQVSPPPRAVRLSLPRPPRSVAGPLIHGAHCLPRETKQTYLRDGHKAGAGSGPSSVHFYLFNFVSIFPLV